MKIRYLAAVLLVASLGTVFAQIPGSETANPTAPAKTAGASGVPLRVGVAPVSPPMIFKEGGKVVGVEADLAQGLGQELAREVRFVELPCEELLGWGVRRSDTQLLESANAFLNRCRASGDLKRVFHRWIPKLQ